MATETPLTTPPIVDGFPRRARIDLQTPAEAAIRAAVAAVENVGADVRLTRAVCLLGDALEELADYIDGVVRPPMKPPRPTPDQVIEQVESKMLEVLAAGPADRKAAVAAAQVLLQLMAKPATEEPNPFRPGSFNLTEASKLVATDPVRARRLAEAAGFTSGEQAIESCALSSARRDCPSCCGTGRSPKYLPGD